MLSQLPSALLGLSALASVANAEEILGAYIFHRHGDRSSKAWKPVNLTALGADQVLSSGKFYNERYVSKGDFHVKGLSSDVVRLSQLSVTSPDDPVLHNSASVFLQGLYPPTGIKETLANGSKVEAPFGGYQYIPVMALENAATSKKAESKAWLQGGSGCSNAEISSNNYFASKEYSQMVKDTDKFYAGLEPVVKSSFDEDYMTFKNAYSSK